MHSHSVRFVASCVVAVVCAVDFGSSAAADAAPPLTVRCRSAGRESADRRGGQREYDRTTGAWWTSRRTSWASMQSPPAR